jgi:hypothetical protein
MRQTIIPFLIVGIAAAIPAAAQTDAAPQRTAAEGTATTLEPEAAAALNRMGAHLRTLRQFEVRSDATIDVVIAANQKLQQGMRTTYLVDAPSRMRVDVETDRQQRRILYDGKALTFTAPVARRYLSLPVTGSIAEVLTQASERFGVEFPLQDLFRWGDASQAVLQPVSGFKVGDVRLGDEMVEHFAYRQDGGVDFQLWLAKGEPLPRKLVITNAAASAQPQVTATFSWNLKPQVDAGDFTFVPAEGWQKVDIAAVAGR